MNTNIKLIHCHYNMDYQLIVAHSKNMVIGNDNSIPWSVPEDLRFFFNTTKNHIIIMGRKTFDSFPNGPLKNRTHIVITNSINNPTIKDVIFTNMDNVFSIVEDLRKLEDKKVFVIGGNEIYKLFLDHCNVLYVTEINIEVDGNVLFTIDVKALESQNIFKIIHKSEIMQSKNNNIEFQYFTYEKC